MGIFHTFLKGAASALALAGLAIVATSASANLVPNFVSVSPPVAGVFTWTYDLQLDDLQQLKAGAQFVIYDFQGYVNGTATLPSLSGPWTVTTQAVGPLLTGAPQTGDDASAINLVYTYGNGPIVQGPSPEGSMSFLDLGTFTAKSTLGLKTGGTYESSANWKDDINGGSVRLNTGGILVPLNPSPEAGSLALLLPGLIPLGMAFRRRIKRA